MKRIVFIDIAKAICIILVVVGHYVPADSPSWYVALHDIIYLFHTTFEGFVKAVFRKLPLDSDLWYVFVPEALVVITCGVVAPIILFKVFKCYKVTQVLFGL